MNDFSICVCVGMPDHVTELLGGEVKVKSAHHAIKSVNKCGTHKTTVYTLQTWAQVGDDGEMGMISSPTARNHPQLWG